MHPTSIVALLGRRDHNAAFIRRWTKCCNEETFDFQAYAAIDCRLVPERKIASYGRHQAQLPFFSLSAFRSALFRIPSCIRLLNPITNPFIVPTNVTNAH